MNTTPPHVGLQQFFICGGLMNQQSIPYLLLQEGPGRGHGRPTEVIGVQWIT